MTAINKLVEWLEAKTLLDTYDADIAKIHLKEARRLAAEDAKNREHSKELEESMSAAIKEKMEEAKEKPIEQYSENVMGITPSGQPWPTPPKEATAGLVEELAELEHDQWMRIRKSTFDKAVALENGAYTINPVQARDWKNMLIPYGELTEELKEYDRIEARKVLIILSRYRPSRQADIVGELKAKIAYLKGGEYDAIPYSEIEEIISRHTGGKGVE